MIVDRQTNNLGTQNLSTPTMGLKLLEIQSKEDFANLMPVFRAGFTNPGTNLWPIFTADINPTPQPQTPLSKNPETASGPVMSTTRPATGRKWLMKKAARCLVAAAGRCTKSGRGVRMMSMARLRRLGFRRGRLVLWGWGC